MWEGQSDEDEFGFTYAQIDKVLYAHVEKNFTPEELISAGFDASLVTMIMERIKNNSFKSKLPTIADLSAIK